MWLQVHEKVFLPKPRLSHSLPYQFKKLTLFITRRRAPHQNHVDPANQQRVSAS